MSKRSYSSRREESPKILFNCTTNVQGGGVKNSAVFIRHGISDSTIDWQFAISPEVCEVLENWGVDTHEMRLFERSPARCKESRSALVELAQRLDVDLVFTMAGPAYVCFDAPHVMGISNGFITHAGFRDMAFGRSLRDFLRVLLASSYKGWKARLADFWIFQTAEARNGFVRRLRVDREKTAVVTNAIDLEFVERFEKPRKGDFKIGKVVKCFVPAAAYRHKGLQFVPRIAKSCVERGWEVEFTLTIDSQNSMWCEIQKEARLLGVSDKVQNIGSYNYADAASLFEEMDIVFVPSFLETFSASYLEAFASRTPLIVADKAFAREICKDGAEYVDPQRPDSVADAILAIAKDLGRQGRLIENGLKVLGDYGDQGQRYSRFIDLLRSVARFRQGGMGSFSKD